MGTDTKWEESLVWGFRNGVGDPEAEITDDGMLEYNPSVHAQFRKYSSE